MRIPQGSTETLRARPGRTGTTYCARFRDNKPFDVFTREQLAGDLMPNATVEQNSVHL